MFSTLISFAIPLDVVLLNLQFYLKKDNNLEIASAPSLVQPMFCDRLSCVRTMLGSRVLTSSLRTTRHICLLSFSFRVGSVITDIITVIQRVTAYHPLKRRCTGLLSLSLVQQCILPDNWPFFRSGTMMTQQNVLLMEMFFLDSMLMIIIVTSLTWEPVSTEVYPWLHSNSISSSETLPITGSPWLIMCQSQLRMNALGKGPVELLKPWGILFICSQQPVEK